MENCLGDTRTQRRKLRRNSQLQADFIVIHPIKSKWKSGTQTICGIFWQNMVKDKLDNKKMHLTETALINVTDNILKAIDEK